MVLRRGRGGRGPAKVDGSTDCRRKKACGTKKNKKAQKSTEGIEKALKEVLREERKNELRVAKGLNHKKKKV